MCPPLCRNPDINLGSAPTEQPPNRSDAPPSRKESLARPSSPATTVIVPSPTKEETEDEAPVCVYRIPKKVKFNVSKVSPLKRKNDFPEKVEVKPELKEGVIAFSLTDRAPMLIQKNLGGGKARCLLQNDPKSRIRNHQELVLLKLDGFLTPEQAGALRRENAGLKERVLTLQKDLHRSTQQLWSAEKEKETLLMEMKRFKSENENLKERMEELKLKITRKDEEILQTEYSLEGEKRSNTKLQEDLKFEKDETEKIKRENDRLRKERNRARIESSSSNGTNNKRQLELLQSKIDSIYLAVVTAEKPRNQIQKKKPRRRLASSQSSSSSSGEN